MKKGFTVSIVIIVSAIAFACFIPADSAPVSGLTTVWTLGSKDASYVEFSAIPGIKLMEDYAAKYPGGFDLKAAGARAKGAFPGVQAGPADSWGGYKTYPIRVKFKLDTVAPGGYVLTVGLAGVSPFGDVELTASIFSENGAAESKVRLERGKDEKPFYLATGLSDPRTVFFYFPADAARAGVNEVTITDTEGSWLLYDYVKLEAVTDASRHTLTGFTAECPPFLAHRGSGAGNLVRANFFAVGAPAEMTAVATVGGAEYKEKVTVKPGPGTIGVVIPEQTAAATAELRVEFNGEVLARSTVTVNPVRHITLMLMPHSHLDIGYPDLQPNIMLDQKLYLEYALDIIERTKDSPAPMTWVVEASWSAINMLLGIGPWEEYGSIMGESLEETNLKPLMDAPGDFWKETVNMRDVAPLAKVTSSAGAPDALNNRRAVDGSPMGWQSNGAAPGSWIELEFDAPHKFKYLAVRPGRELSNRILQAKITLDGDETKLYKIGPMGEHRERSFVTFDYGVSARKVRFEIISAADNNQPTAIMEFETWSPVPAEQTRERLIRAIRDGRVEITGLYMNFLTQLIPTEWLIRSMLRSNVAAEKSGVPLKTALITDVPGYSFAVPDILAGSGIKYFYPALNPDHAKTCLTGMPRAFWWVGPGGGRVLVFHSFDTYMEGWRMGFTVSADLVERSLPGFIATLDAQGYPYDTAPLRTLGDTTDDGPVGEKLPEVVAEWNRRWAWPRVELSIPSKFFPDFEKKYGASLPTLTGDWTGYWEDGAASSAMETFEILTSHRALLFTSAFNAFFNLMKFPDAYNEYLTEMNDSYSKTEENLYLYDEHTWGADMSVAEPENQQTLWQWELKKDPIRRAYDDIDETVKIFVPLINRFAPKPSHGGKIVAVVNPTGKARAITAIVDLESPDNKSYKVYDLSTGKEALSVDTEDFYDRILPFYAENVPAMGVKYYEAVATGELTERTEKAEKEESKKDKYVIENSFYRLTVDGASGRIESIYDKELKRELVDSSGGFGMNEFLYISGFDYKNPTKIQNVRINVGEDNSLLTELTINGETPMFKWVSRKITLNNKRKEIQFLNLLIKEKTYEKEAAYFAFPFNVPGGELRLEVTGGMITPEKDQVSGAARDWVSIQDTAAALGDDYSILFSTPDAPLVVPCEMTVLSFKTKNECGNTTFFSYVMNNYWHTNYLAGQGGLFVFRYSITSVKGRAKDSDIVNFGIDTSDTLKAFKLEGEGSDNNAGAISFMSVDPATVRLLGVKTAEDKRGIIVRLQELDGVATKAKISVNPILGLKNAEPDDLLERPLGSPALSLKGDKPAVEVDVPARGIVTVRLY